MLVKRDANVLFGDFYMQISLLWGAALTAYLTLTPTRIEPGQYALAIWLTVTAIVLSRLEWLNRHKKLLEI